MISSTPVIDVTEVEWVPVVRQYTNFHSGGFPEMGLKALMTVTPHPKKPTSKKELVFRMGIGLVRELEWEAGDSIITCYDKDDVHSMMIMKHPKGSKLMREGGSKSNGKILRLAINAEFLTCGSFRSTTQIYKLDKVNKRLFVKLSTEEPVVV